MKAIYAGSFDPFTNGHLSVIKEAASIFDKVFVVIALNSKKSRVFHEADMFNAMNDCITRCGIDNAVVVPFDGLIAELAKSLEVKYLVRGIRNTNDFMYEEEIAKFNSKINQSLSTIYLRAKDDAVSSSMVRELLLHDKDVSDLVPEDVLKIIQKERPLE